MAVRQFRKRGFSTKREAESWAKAEKNKYEYIEQIKWEVQRADPDDQDNWYAVLFREV